MRLIDKSLLSVVILVILCTTSVDAVLGRTGEMLYETKCGRCHEAPKPNAYSAEEWPGEVRAMRAQAALTEAQYNDIVDYLTTASAHSSESHGSGPNLGGYMYTEFFHTQEKQKNWDLHYLAFFVSGWANDRINYFAEFELEHGGTDDHAFVEQAYIDFWLTPFVALKVGGFLTPFNRFDEFHGPLQNYTISRPQMAREIGVSGWKDVGASLHGFLPFDDKNSLLFDVYTINGLGDGSSLRGSRQYRDNNENMAFGARASLLLQNTVEIGVSGYHGAWDDDGNLNVNMFGAHVLWPTSVIDYYGEFSKASSENPAGVDDGDMSGYFVQASRLFPNGVRPTIRYGTLDYLDPGAEFGRSPRDTDLSELVLSLDYYPTHSTVIKAEYQILMEGSRATSKDNNVFGLQFALQF